MKINRHNYEAYLLDWMEGRLTAREQQEVRDFLRMNPDIEQNPVNMDLWILEKEKISYPGKKTLKKELPDASSRPAADNFDLFSIARMEGDLTEAQVRQHETLIRKDKKLSREWSRWESTKLVAREISYPGRDQLKKKVGTRTRVIWLSVISTAAAVALLVTLFTTVVRKPTLELAEEVGMITEQERVQGPDQFASPQQGDSAQGDPGTIPGSDTNRETSNHVYQSTLLADQPVTLSIKKQQDPPPELTGIGKGREKSDVVPDTTIKANPQKTKPGPVRITSLGPVELERLNTGRYDRITPLEIPPASIHMTSLSISQLAELDIQEMVEEYAENSDFSIWTIANAGIKGINRLTGSDISLLASRNEEGELSGIRFKSKRISIATPLDRSE
jgi:hypothetical protein